MTVFDAAGLRRVGAILARATEEREVPGAVACLGVGSECVWLEAYGEAESSPYKERPMATGTIFDLASLTKVVATLPVILSLVEEGRLALFDPVALHLPEFAGEGREQVTIAHLLSHTAGLISGREFYRTHTGPALVHAAITEPMAGPPGERAVYSDIGFIMLGEIAARAAGKSLAEAARERVFEPLGMRDTGYLPAPALRGRIAATEAKAGRELPKVGVVHDENADAMGGVAGHAGLFAPAEDLGRYLALWVGAAHGVLAPWTLARAVACHTPAPWRRGWGWVLKGDGMDHTGDLWPETTIAHTGFTGTSLAADPASGAWAVLLTNRVHFGRQVDVRRLRARFHNAAAAAVR
jgi:CubicO group peptidase (beta-lactamase class C family)